ncbi:protein escargot [Microplitis demolitor]|uniref:protein escargot n=1 Tax=Microplitis demolitor TaxID=69319 RepID=UPI0004CD2642|nr:protein escargot [Microplitis demolitor]
MLVEEMPRSFVKKNNSYSHCPLKKRPVHVLYEEVPESVKDEIIDVVTDDIPEPENLSTKPEDLSLTAEKFRPRSLSRSPSPCAKVPRQSIDQCSPLRVSAIQSLQPTAIHHQLHYPSKPITPPVGIAPVNQIVKKERVEVIQHDGGSSSSALSPINYLATKTPLEPLNLNTPVEPVAHYATPAWTRAPLYPPHYLPYSPAYRFPQHPTGELYPSYPLAGYHPHSSPEHASLSPPPHSSLTCPTIQRPIPRNYWTASSPDHCTLSPTSTMSYGPLRSPPPVTPEDLSSPGSDSGRSSAGSTSAGSTILMKMDSTSQNIVGTPSAASTVSTNSSSSPRYQCPDCGKSYSTYSGLSKHQQFHCAAAEGQTKKSFSCKYCEKVYVSLGALKMHIRTHTLPCKCHLCGKAFSRPWLLQGHIRTHTGEKPFSCQHCNRAFADRSNLRAHLQTHSDVKKYSCSSCSKTFSRMSLLTKHQEGGCPGINVPIGYNC